MSHNVQQLNFEGARIGFRNFAGEEGPYNAKGDRSFVIFLEEDVARDLEKIGWNVKWPKARDVADEEDTRQPHLAVSVAMNNYPPKIVMISGENTNLVAEEELGMLDWVEIDNVDLVVRPYSWNVNGKSGIKAYLKAIYVTIKTDMFVDKYGI